MADLENASPAERARYLEGIPIDAESDEAGEILDALETHGMRVVGIDRQRAFEDVRRVGVRRGRTARRGRIAARVRLRRCRVRLRIEQLGGYQDIAVPPWIPIGVTGVVRRAERNGTVVTTEPGEALMIPGELFAREWFRPYEQGELGNLLAEFAG